MTDSYDQVAYQGFPFPESHPDRLCIIGRLLGMDPAPAARCRVLELGCGDGGNLIPMALALPESDFVGIDLAAQPVARGCAIAAELGLRNIRLTRMDVRDFPPDAGPFDYIIAYGLYSWTPEDARRQVLAIAGAQLRPQGIAYVNYNVFPGCHARLMLREMMLAHTRTAESPADRIELARQFLAALPDSAALAAEGRRLLGRTPAALFHDELDEFYHPLYFRDFIREAAAHGLQYLAEATLSDTHAAAEDAAIAGLMEREQHLDYLMNRAFRQTLLCRAEVVLDHCLRTSPIASLWAASPATSSSADGGQTEFRTEHSVLGTAHPAAIAVLNALIEAWPRAVPAAELPGDPQQVEAILLSAFAGGLVRLYATPPALAAVPAERPVASPLARIQGRTDETITTLLHTSVEVSDPIVRRLLVLLDGTRDRAALVDELLPLVGGSRETLAPALDRNLAAFARLGLLATPPADRSPHTPASPHRAR